MFSSDQISKLYIGRLGEGGGEVQSQNFGTSPLLVLVVVQPVPKFWNRSVPEPKSLGQGATQSHKFRTSDRVSLVANVGIGPPVPKFWDQGSGSTLLGQIGNRKLILFCLLKCEHRKVNVP